MERVKADICIIGAGSAGLSVAAGAAQLGARTVLFERDKMGGDCLNYGCVPSKSLIAAAKAAATIRTAERFGLKAAPPEIDFPKVKRHIDGVIAAIAPNDSVERFEGLGVRVIRAEAHFTGPREVAGGGVTVRARRFVIATGSVPSVPPITGLGQFSYFTNETIFANTARVEHLLVIGGGPIGIELAQAYRRLGSTVTVFEALKILGQDDPELKTALCECLKAEGIALKEGVKISRVERNGDQIDVVLTESVGERRVTGSHLLVATGRKPRVEGLGLEKAGIAYTSKGITVDAGLRTTNRLVYAIGDVAGGLQFTHVASYHAGLVIRSALFRLPIKVDYRALPAVTFTDPELAQVGLTEAAARERHGGDVEVLRAPFDHNDRAQTERATEGLAKIVVRKNGTVLGASILGPHAGELIHLWALAIHQKIGLRPLTGMIAPYPTLGEISKRAAGNYYAARLFSKWPKRIVRLLRWLG